MSDQGSLRGLLDQEPQPGEPEWVQSVRAGAWDAIPKSLSFYGSEHLAYLINGYEVAKLLRANHASDVSQRAWMSRDPETGRWGSSAVELWITLFFAHRADHFSGYFVPVDPPPGYVPPDPSPPRPELDALCRDLRLALLEGRHWPDR